ncbi:MAG: response regulator transcription factor [Deltaproteobacteria bacterium]|nr:response regulator transcription factor [Deltaproteobacteria bacterium]
MTNTIRLIIADDHPIVRHGLRQVIERDPQLQVVAEADNGRAALEAMQQLRPQVVLLDVDMPHMHGFDVARALQAAQLAVALIFLTVHREEDFFNEAMSLGAKGYVLKDSAITDIVTAIKAVAAGEYFVSPALTSLLINRNFSRQQLLVPRLPGLNDLTPTERRVLQMLADYQTSREIANALGISHRTVQTHRANICQKLDLQGNHALMKFALAHKEEL